MADRALRLYAEDHPALARTLKAKLRKRAEELSAQVAAGFALDWPDYKQRTGTIKGLVEAIELCEAQEDEQDGDR